MYNIARTPFAAVFQAEVLINMKRVAPYAMMLLFSGNALLWWGAGPAEYRGWATNSEHFIIAMTRVFSFMTVPLFTALIMGEPVIRDFKVGIDPLVFSKPVSRAEYLLGKFFGNFFVLVCCQACFSITFFVLQGVSVPGMLVVEPRVLPYFKHFFTFVVVSHLLLAAIYFAVGTLTRNVKIVYALGLAFYPVFITYQAAVLKRMTGSVWRTILDPLAFNWIDELSRGRSAEWLNQATFGYTADLIVNRLLVILLSAACFAIVYFRFSRVERSGNREAGGPSSIFNLAPPSERLYQETGDSGLGRYAEDERPVASAAASVVIPAVDTSGRGIRENFGQFLAALEVELRLLRAEHSLVVVIPIVLLMCGIEVGYFNGGSGPPYSAEYAGVAAQVSLLFILGIAVFYTGEAMHRDRELRVEPLLWSAPTRNFVLLLSKFSAVFLILISLIILLLIMSVAAQAYKGHGPVDLLPHLAIHSLISIPNAVFIIGASVALNVLLRDKYLVYAVSIATCGGMLYLFKQGYNNWLYNPVLFQLWSWPDLSGGGGNQTRILAHRVYVLALTALCLALAHLFFGRRSSGGIYDDGSLSGRSLAALIIIISAAVAGAAGMILIRAS